MVIPRNFFRLSNQCLKAYGFGKKANAPAIESFLMKDIMAKHIEVSCLLVFTLINLPLMQIY